MKLKISIRTHLLILIAAGVASAQVPEVVHTLRWSEVYAGTATVVANPNGMIEPGEAMMLSLSVSFTPAVGTPVSYWGGTAPLAAYRASGFKLNAIGALGGTWTHFSSPAGFTVGFLPPPVELDGSILAGVSQGWQPHPWMPNASTPIDDVWRAVWTPPSYSHRNVRFLMRTWEPPFGPPPAPSNMYVFDGTNYIATDATAVWDSVQFPVVPAPGVLIALIGGVIVAGRRRR